MRHRTTDPACVHHRPPTGWFSRWRFDRARGLSCMPCALLRHHPGVWQEWKSRGKR